MSGERSFDERAERGRGRLRCGAEDEEAGLPDLHSDFGLSRRTECVTSKVSEVQVRYVYI